MQILSILESGQIPDSHYLPETLFPFTEPLDSHTNFGHIEPFLPLEPPLTSADYSFCLSADEGLSDLFNDY